MELNGLFDFAGFEAFYADAYPHRRAVYDGPDSLQIRKEAADIYARYLLSDAAFTLG